jgi:hypothetical protein
VNVPFRSRREIGKMTAVPIRLRLLLASLLAFAALSGCATQQHSRDLLRESLFQYEGAIRWSRFDAAANFLDPEQLERRPLSALDMQRYEQVQVTGYKVLGSTTPAEGELLQQVEIRVINRHTQTERTLVDAQRWRYDEEQRRWWLTSGLPRLTESR